MSYSLYSKPFKPPADLVKDLQAKGLRIKDVNKAERILADINYYRFKIYLVPLQNSGSKIFKPNAVFEDAVQLYCFDDELRDLLFSAIGRIEIKLRSKLDQVVCSHTQNPFWYLDRGLFGTGFYNVESTLSKLASDFQRSKDDYSVHFKSRYFNDQHDGFKQLPPFWVASELMTFGQTKTLFEKLDKTAFKLPANGNELDNLARMFGAKNLKTLNNWLALIQDVRNRCAHHSRTWNANYREPHQIWSMLNNNYLPAHKNRIYLCIAMMHHIDNNLGMSLDLKHKLQTLFSKYPIALQHAKAAGFPQNWDKDSFWD